jgi:hypothetical protein
MRDLKMIELARFEVSFTASKMLTAILEMFPEEKKTLGF